VLLHHFALIICFRVVAFSSLYIVNQFITIAAEYAGKLQSIKVHIHK